MPDYSSLLEMMGYEAGTLPELFGQYFEEPKAVWSKFLEPSFGYAQEALGELPGLRGGMLGQLTSGLQQRGITAGRGLQARRAGAGFAGSGALDRLGRTTRRGLEAEYGRGRWRIGQDIERREAGILGALSGNVGSFLQALLSAGTELAVGPSPPGLPATDPDVIAQTIAAGAPDIPGTEGEISYDGQWIWKGGIWGRRTAQPGGYEGPEDAFKYKGGFEK